MSIAILERPDSRSLLTGSQIKEGGRFVHVEKLFTRKKVRFDVSNRGYLESQYQAVDLLTDKGDAFLNEWRKLEFLSTETAMHTLGVIYFLRKLGEAYNSTHDKEVDLNAMELDATLHDLGKTHPDILGLTQLPRELLKEEKKTVDLHTEYGALLLHRAEFNRSVSLAAKYHHTRYDELLKLQNNNELTGPEVLSLSMVRLADSSEAAINKDRVYKTPKKPAELIQEVLADMKNGNYHPDLEKSYKDMWADIYLDTMIGRSPFSQDLFV